MSARHDRQARTRLVNATVQRVLVAGLTVAAVLMLAGLAVVLAGHLAVPHDVLKLAPALRRAVRMHGDGLLTLGLLMLILTPFLRVVGTALVFAWERDWRYVAITLLVLAVMIAGLFIGGA